MTHLIRVAPQGAGWLVQSPALPAPLVFHSGARAETAARDLAQSLAETGRETVLEITLRDGALAGRIVFPGRRAA